MRHALHSIVSSLKFVNHWLLFSIIHPWIAKYIALAKKSEQIALISVVSF
jgi:predicted amidophosphoribosyltransferase